MCCHACPHRTLSLGRGGRLMVSTSQHRAAWVASSSLASSPGRTAWATVQRRNLRSSCWAISSSLRLAPRSGVRASSRGSSPHGMATRLMRGRRLVRRAAFFDALFAPRLGGVGGTEKASNQKQGSAQKQRKQVLDVVRAEVARRTKNATHAQDIVHRKRRGGELLEEHRHVPRPVLGETPVSRSRGRRLQEVGLLPLRQVMSEWPQLPQ